MTSLLHIHNDIIGIVLQYLEFDDYDSISQLIHFDMKGPVKKKLALLKKQSYYKHFDSEKDKIIAVQQNGVAIKYIHNPSEDLCKLAVQQKRGLAIKYIHNPSEDVCKLAVQQNGYAIQYIHNPSEDLCKLAVQQHGYAIQYIHNPSEDLCKLAVQRNPNAIQYIKFF